MGGLFFLFWQNNKNTNKKKQKIEDDGGAWGSWVMIIKMKKGVVGVVGVVGAGEYAYTGRKVQIYPQVWVWNLSRKDLNVPMQITVPLSCSLTPPCKTPSFPTAFAINADKSRS